MTRHGARTAGAAGGSGGWREWKFATSVPPAGNVPVRDRARPQLIDPALVIAAIGLAAEAILPWVLIWLSDVYLFEVPVWSQWVIFGGPPALSLLAMTVYWTSRA